MELHSSLIEHKDKFINYENPQLQRREFGIYIVKARSSPCNGNYSMLQFNEGIEFNGVNGNASFEKCVFFGKVSILYRESIELKFKECFFEGELSVEKNLQKNLVFESCSISSMSQEFSGGSIHLIDTYIEKIVVSGEVQNFRISNSQITKKYKMRSLSFVKSCNQLASIHLSNLNAEKIEFNGLSGNAKFHMHDSQVDFIDFNDSRTIGITLEAVNSQYFKFMDARNGCDITVSKNSSIGDIELIKPNNSKIKLTSIACEMVKLQNVPEDCSFDLSQIKNIDKLILWNVKSKVASISEVGINSMSIDANTRFNTWNIRYIFWSKNFELKIPEESDKDETLKLLELIETSRQFKKYFNEQDNLIDAQTFKISELDSLKKYLEKRNKNRDITSGQYWDLWILRTNKWFSNFGNSVILPLKWLFGLHTIFFLLVIVLNSDRLDIKFCFDWSDSCQFSFTSLTSFISLYFHYLNPIHKISDFNGNTFYSFWDFVMRISSGYFIYYFLRASRKFSSI